MTTTAPTNVSNSWTWQEVELGAWDTILQLVSACLGALGNLVVIIVLFPRRSSSRSTDTLIGCLAVADFLTSLFLLPFPRASTVPSSWVGMIYCWTVYTVAYLWTCITASIYILLVICVDRYIAIVHPLKYNRYFSRRRALHVVAVIWICSLANFSTAISAKIDPTTRECVVRFASDFIEAFVGCLNLVFLYLIPVMTMFVTQIFMARALLRQSHRFSDNGYPQSRPTFHLVARRKVLRMLTIVVAIFIVSFGPNQFTYFSYNLRFLPEGYYLSKFHRFTFVLATFNSCANPIIYAWQNKRFRQGIRNMGKRSTPAIFNIFDHM